MARTSDSNRAYKVHIMVDAREFEVDVRGKSEATSLADAVRGAAEAGRTHRFDPGDGSTVVINFANVGCTIVSVIAGQGGAINIRR
jgi:hypothetical protein